MPPPRRLPALLSRLRRPRPTARLRLTAVYGGLFMAAGTTLLAFTYWLFNRATTVTLRTGAVPGLSRFQCKLSVGASAQPGTAHPSAPPAPGQVCQSLHAALRQLHAINLHALAVESAIALAVVAALAVASGWFVAGRMLHPLRAITATARRISATSLHERLAVTGPDDEFKELADTFDALMAHLETSFQAQQHFVASASHELRTPLTLERALLQVALRNTGTSIEQWRSTGQKVIASGQHHERLLEALLTLATSEAGISHREHLDLAEITAASLRTASAQMQRQRLHAKTSLSPAPLPGDPVLIERLVANLVDNAITHNTPGGTVIVTTGQRASQAILTVTNTGPPIPPTEIDRLFQPFQRLATARTSHGHGHGLGLSIAKAIATAHNAVLTAHPRPEGGLHIEASFPATDCPPVR
jgi:signal transduction histidine kinase